MCLLLFLLLIQLPLGLQGDANFTLYEDRQFRCCLRGCGTCETFQIEDDECIGFNFYNSRVSSIDPHDTCVILWDKSYCRGNYVILMPNSSDCAPLDLSPCGWNDRMVSISGCKIPRDLPPVEIQLYDHTNHNCLNEGKKCGKCETLKFNENVCLDVKQKVSSINNYKNCITIWENENCSGRQHSDDPIYTYPTCDRLDLSTCGWNQSLSSISSCNYPTNNGKEPPGSNMLEVKVFEEPNYNCCEVGGSCGTFTIPGGGCRNVGDLNNVVSSIYMFEDTCVRVWDEEDCKGQNKYLSKSRRECNLGDLSSCGWDNRISSISTCHHHGDSRDTQVENNRVKCSEGSWVKEVMNRRQGEFGLQIDCYEPGGSEPKESIELTKGVSMFQDQNYTCKNTVLRGFAISQDQISGLCTFENVGGGDGSFCPNNATGVCGIDLTLRENKIYSGHPICCETQNFEIFSVKNSSPTDFSMLYFSMGIAIVIFLFVIIGGAILYDRNYSAQRLGREKAGFMKAFKRGTTESDASAAEGYKAAQQMPYNHEQFDVNLNNLTISDTPLGEGEFGKVLRGKLRTGTLGEEMEVAVKTQKQSTNWEYTKALLCELKVMMYIGDHPYIVKLIGANIQLNKSLFCIVLRLCQNGNLLDYIRKLPRTCDRIMNFQRWVREICSGMKYLAEKKVVHGDLAARNILLDESFRVKVADFGLSTCLYQYVELERKDRHTKRPFRWMSIETQTQLQYSEKSDVWAFGVTVWEIYSLGDIPYAEVDDHSLEFIENLRKGNRLKRPQLASETLYEIMNQTWAQFANDRPTFEDLEVMLQTEFPTVQIILDGNHTSRSGISNGYVKTASSKVQSPV